MTQISLSDDERSDETEDDEPLGFECDVDGCDNRIVGLDDGWKMPRGHVCQDCIEYDASHGHYPDEDPRGCRECHVEYGGVVHDCPESHVDVLLDDGDECSFCEEVVRAI